MNESANEKELSRTASRQILAGIDAKYRHGWFVAISDDRAIAASADFDELLGNLHAQGRDPRATLVVQAADERPEYVTIFI